MSNHGKCLNPSCGSDAGTRGLCPACYNAAAYVVRSGKTTWDGLEKRGKIAPRKRRTPNDVAEWLLDFAEDDSPPRSMPGECDYCDVPLANTSAHVGCRKAASEGM